ncbi:hypothetical protein D0T90_05850 [Neisseria animalis]|uniref:Uncharacterized protein n=1 Tax=Neisseria animalis TaxID=492 RepID=A0A5P3MR51_NEIAN|nr:hypothetical protein D0T90_05850 [Neisseria animalis]ROW32644.1 hypothetical protein CGZ60_04190 [Neisseria animalis]
MQQLPPFCNPSCPKAVCKISVCTKIEILQTAFYISAKMMMIAAAPVMLGDPLASAVKHLARD